MRLIASAALTAFCMSGIWTNAQSPTDGEKIPINAAKVQTAFLQSDLSQSLRNLSQDGFAFVNVFAGVFSAVGEAPAEASLAELDAEIGGPAVLKLDRQTARSTDVYETLLSEIDSFHEAFAQDAKVMGIETRIIKESREHWRGLADRAHAANMDIANSIRPLLMPSRIGAFEDDTTLLLNMQAIFTDFARASGRSAEAAYRYEGDWVEQNFIPNELPVPFLRGTQYGYVRVAQSHATAISGLLDFMGETHCGTAKANGTLPDNFSLVAKVVPLSTVTNSEKSTAGLNFGVDLLSSGNTSGSRTSDNRQEKRELEDSLDEATARLQAMAAKTDKALRQVNAVLQSTGDICAPESEAVVGTLSNLLIGHREEAGLRRKAFRLAMSYYKLDAQ